MNCPLYVRSLYVRSTVSGSGQIKKVNLVTLGYIFTWYASEYLFDNKAKLNDEIGHFIHAFQRVANKSESSSAFSKLTLTYDLKFEKFDSLLLVIKKIRIKETWYSDGEVAIRRFKSRTIETFSLQVR